MDLDAAAEELYAGSPDEFIERRTALVAQARAARDRPLAKQIGGLRRPTRTAWLLNLLARRSADGVGELLSLGLSLQDAQRRLAGAELRQLSAERRRLVDRLAREAVQLGAAHGYEAPEAALQEVSQTLQAALADPAVGEQLREGRLTAAVTYGGFGPTDLTAALAASLPTPTERAPALAGAGRQDQAGSPEPPQATAAEPQAAAGPTAPTEPGQPTEPDPVTVAVAEERRRRETLAEEAESAWATARAALDEAAAAAEEATARADELADRIEELRSELRRMEAAESDARDAARAARRAHQEARRTATAAEHARDAALRNLAEGG